MRFASVLTIAGFLATFCQVKAADVDTYIASEGPIAKAGVLANIGSSGSKSNGAKDGIVSIVNLLESISLEI